MTLFAPTKIIALGLNYIDHANELKMKAPDEPIIFLKPPSALIGDGDEIVYPGCVKQLDYEAELALVIKKKAKDVPEGAAMEYVLGYTCLNDVTARDLQRKDGQWTRAKSFDTFCPVGPRITPAAEFDPSDVRIQARLNGAVKQSSSTKNMIFKIPKIISFVSSIMTLNPNDIIATGTPVGVGTMNVGDMIEIIIEGIGVLKNRVVAA
jgi:2-keto-4-pentenoate hydratase/2-oxohepta-3-ene-1,7-dioic acid hydratase in catechol pathway